MYLCKCSLYSFFIGLISNQTNIWPSQISSQQLKLIPAALHPARHNLIWVNLPVHPSNLSFILVLAEHKQPDDDDADQDDGQHDGDDQPHVVFLLLYAELTKKATDGEVLGRSKALNALI